MWLEYGKVVLHRAVSSITLVSMSPAIDFPKARGCTCSSVMWFVFQHKSIDLRQLMLAKCFRSWRWALSSSAVCFRQSVRYLSCPFFPLLGTCTCVTWPSQSPDWPLQQLMRLLSAVVSVLALQPRCTSMCTPPLSLLTQQLGFGEKACCSQACRRRQV